jgi:magnesium chelatase family protein
VGLLGGGRPLRPGEITLAHRGVLFLDEIAEFGRERLDRLREPLGEGWVDLSRAGEQYRFPARFQLVAAGNPCPCGWYGSHVDRCRCEPHAVARYRRRLSGPLRDRIDLWVEMDREPADRIFAPSSERETLDVARVRALRRENDAREEFSPSLRDSLRRCRLDAPARELLRELADRRAASLRAVASVLRVARSIADLAGEARVRDEDLAEAFTYRPPAC